MKSEHVGYLLVDDIEVHPSEPRWRENCAFVRQEPELVPGALFDNLRDFPGWTEPPPLTEAVDAVVAGRLIGAAGLVAIDDKGVSGGQRRAVSVLRAIGSNASVLLLDEPLAGLDDQLVPPLAAALAEAIGAGKLVVMAAHEHDMARLGVACEVVVHPLFSTDPARALR